MNKKKSLKYMNFNNLNLKKVEFILNFMNENPDILLVINIDNTMSLSDDVINKLYNTDVLLRISSGYSDDKLNKYGNSSTTFDFLLNDNIYNVSECRLIMNEINKIESYINDKWTSEEKLLYLINYIQNNIRYEVELETAPSKEIRSLRGLYLYRTVCAGYSLILKELCDRNNIECQLVLGYVLEDEKKSNNNNPTHAWNIVSFNNNYFPIELTWSSSKYRDGDFLQIEDLFNTKEFVKHHIPDDRDNIINYNDLKSIDKNYLKKILINLRKNETTSVNGFTNIRKDGSKYFVSLVDSMKKDNQNLYKYIYCDIVDDKVCNPILLYSSEIVVNSKFLSFQKLREKLKNKLEKCNDNEIEYYKTKNELHDLEFQSFIYTSNVNEKLFSRDNIYNSLNNHHFLGKFDDINSSSANINTDNKVINKFPITFKNYKRKDGSLISVSSYRRGKYFEYYVYEVVDDLTHKEVFKNYFNLKYDLFSFDDEFVCSQFLSRDKLNNYNSLENITLTNDKIYDYYEPISYDMMRKLVEDYKYSWVINKAVSKKDKKQVTDNKLNNQIKYANAWYEAIRDDKNSEDIDKTFSRFNEKLYNVFKKTVTLNLEKNNGKLDVIMVKTNLSNLFGNNNIVNKKVNKIFRNRYIVKSFIDMYKLENMDSNDIDYELLDKYDFEDRIEISSSNKLLIFTKKLDNIRKSVTNVCKFNK